MDLPATTGGPRQQFNYVHLTGFDMITVDKNAAYPAASKELKEEQTLEAETELRQSKYLNNVIEQDHRNVKRIMKLMMGFQSFNTASRTLRGIEAMNMIRTRTSEGSQPRG